MIIELPYHFYSEKKEGNFARVHDGTLEIHGPWNFEKLMVELTYRIKGRTKCFYCRRKVEGEKITIDHLYPRDFGGITITNNLEPACRSCNSKKSNMNQYEYEVWRTISSENERRSYYHSIVSTKERRIRAPNIKKGFDLPKRWIEYRRLNTINTAKRINNSDCGKFKRIMKFVKRTGKLPRPIVISSNCMLLDGMTTYNVAEHMKLEEVPVIILENVVAFRN